VEVREGVHRHQAAPGPPRPATSWPPAPTPDETATETWIPPGADARIHGLVIPGGFLYLGRRLDPVGFSRDPEPALIDPSLPVYLSEPDLAGTSLGYWLSYSRISPRARAGYLHWLWSKKKTPKAPIGYVFLYFYGLERRVLHDRLLDSAVASELPAIRAEVDRLVGIYGTDETFRTYATRFGDCLEILDRLGTTAAGPVPHTVGSAQWELPAVIRFELARMAASGMRLPPSWALAWVRHAPDISLRTAALRCGDEFDQLFPLRYAAKFGEGLALATNKARLRMHYRPASPSFTGEVTLPVGDLPDPSVLVDPTHRLAALAGAVATELDAYSRLIGKHPEARDTLPAVALLPSELAGGAAADAAAELWATIDGALAGETRVALEAARLVSCWPAAKPGHLAKPEAIALAQLLAARGIGVEPDVRFGGPILGVGQAVLFRLDAQDLDARDAAPGAARPEMPSSSAVTATLQLAATVAIAAGPLDAIRAEAVATAALEVFEPSGSGIAAGRAAAHLQWASQVRPKSTALKRRLGTLDEDQRTAIGAQLIRLAATAGHVGPAQMAALTAAFGALALDTAALFTQVHQATTTGPAPADTGRPQLETAAVGEAGRHGDALHGAGLVELDPSRIRARLAETAEVAAFLGQIFIEDDPAGPVPAPSSFDGGARSGVVAAEQNPSPPTIGELDPGHSELLRRLAARPSWTRGEVEELARALDLLPDGAVDTLNEVALDRSGEPLCEGTDPVEINPYALEELLR
jgi:hypothetical protein